MQCSHSFDSSMLCAHCNFVHNYQIAISQGHVKKFTWFNSARILSSSTRLTDKSSFSMSLKIVSSWLGDTIVKNTLFAVSETPLFSSPVNFASFAQSIFESKIFFLYCLWHRSWELESTMFVAFEDMAWHTPRRIGIAALQICARI